MKTKKGTHKASLQPIPLTVPMRAYVCEPSSCLHYSSQKTLHQYFGHPVQG